jgi:serine/threonine protein phosphatase PrpC
VSTTVRPDEASQLAADAAAAVLAAADPAVPPPHLAAYDAARAAVATVDATPEPGLGPPSCTYLAGVITDRRISLAHLGDCRAYWRPSAEPVRQLTVDDSWATQQVAAGLMEATAAYADPRAHSITAWLGRDADPAWTPALVELDVPPAGGRLLLVSDGLWNYTPSPDDVAALLDAGDPGPLATARRLVDHANASGGADNITVVVVDLPLRPPSPPSPPKGPTPA